MRLGSIAALVIALVIAASCTKSSSSPTQPTQTSTPTVPACSVRVWGCATNGYGALAWSSSTGASGVSYNYGTLAQAQDSAIGYCGKSDCTMVAWFQNSCGALASAPTGQMATGTATTGDTAQAFAVAACITK